MIYAYTNFNFGDDLFIKILCERYPKTKFILYAPHEYNLTLKEINNISIIPSDTIINRGINFLLKRFKINYSIQEQISKSCDAGVNIGGSLFIQGENWERRIQYNKNLRIKDKPFYLLGANFGPYTDLQFYQEYKELFKGYTDICFRERYSYEIFNDLSNVRMASDIIFQLKKKNIKNEESTIVISVIKPSFRKNLNEYDDIYYKKIKDITLHFIERGYKVTLMSFCENEGDKEAVDAIMSLIPKVNLHKVNSHLYKLNIEETLNVIAKSSFVIATRFHSMILGWVYNKPVYPIVYSSKMTNVMKDVSFDGSYVDIKNMYALKPEEVFESMTSNLIDVSKQAKNAEKHFEILDNFLLK